MRKNIFLLGAMAAAMAQVDGIKPRRTKLIEPSYVPPENLLPRLIIPINEVAQGCIIETRVVIFTRDKYTIKITADIMYRTAKGKQKKNIKT